MNSQVIKNISQAHNQLGMLLSGLLFVIFFAGSISLFRVEINNWQWLGHSYPNSQNSQNRTATQLTPFEVLEKLKQQLTISNGATIKLVYPHDNVQYYQAKVQPDLASKAKLKLIIDPLSGEIISDADDASLGDFLFHLHSRLMLPGGRYITSLLALFLLFVIVSGVIIHWQKLVGQLFKFRADHPRDRWLDLHKLIGVVGLPFSLLLAFTGGVFNLVVIYKIVFAALLYEGDKGALVADAGLYSHHIKASGRADEFDLSRFNLLQDKASARSDLTPKSLEIKHYNDENAVVRLQFKGDEFSPNQDLFYRLRDLQLLFDNYDENSAAKDNTFRQGLGVLKQLHVAGFAANQGAYALKWLYFLLTQMFCLLLLTGHIMWLNKQAIKPTHGPVTLALIRATILALIPGTIVATSVGFIIAQLSPSTMLAVNAHWQSMAYITVLGGTFVAGLIVQNHKNLLTALMLTTLALSLVAGLFAVW